AWIPSNGERSETAWRRRRSRRLRSSRSRLFARRPGHPGPHGRRTSPRPPRPTPWVPASPSPTCETSWDVLPSIDPDQEGNQLLAVAAAPDGQMWAVGGFGPPEAPTSTLVERWDGQLWVVTATPNAGTVNVLNAVTVAGPDDVWGGGRSSNGVGGLPLVGGGGGGGGG